MWDWFTNLSHINTDKKKEYLYQNTTNHKNVKKNIKAKDGLNKKITQKKS